MINRLIEHTAQLGIMGIFTFAAMGIQNHVQTDSHYAQKYRSLSGADLQKLKKADELKAITAGATLGLLTALAYFPVGNLRRRTQAEPKTSQP